MKKINLVLIVFMLISALAMQKITAQKEVVELTAIKICVPNKCELNKEKKDARDKNKIMQQTVSDSTEVIQNKNYDQPSPLIGFPSAKDFEE